MRPLSIFLSVGSQMPFDRLTAAVAAWARNRPQRHPPVQLVAQVGHTRLEAGQLEGLQWFDLLEPERYLQCCRDADLMVAHAGMGSVLTALDLHKPLLVMPRRGALAETRNDHQLDTARHLQARTAADPRLIVAWDEGELPARLEAACVLAQCSSAPQPAETRACGPSRAALIAHLRGLLDRPHR